MKITPILKRGQIGATKFTVEVNETDAIYLAALLSYARRAGLDNMHPSERRRTDRMLNQLAAACYSINCDADALLDEVTEDWHKTLLQFDPGYTRGQ